MPFLSAIEDRLMELPSAILERGRQYWQKQHLLGIEKVPSRQGTAWQADVQGSETRPYQVFIAFDNNGKLRQSYCSCPMGGNCKHEVAALLELMQHESSSARSTGAPVREVHGCQPVPHLHFDIWQGLVDRKRVSWPVAQLRADYDGDQCRPQQHGRQLAATDAEGLSLLIERDMAAEHRWVEALRPMQTLHVLLGWQAPEGESRFDMTLRDQADWPRFFHNRLPTLLNEGWQITYADDFPFRLQDVDENSWYGTLEEGSGNAWFSLEMGIEVDGERISLVPLLVQALEQMNPRQREAILQTEGGKSDMHLMHGNRLLRVPMARMRPLLQVLVDIFDREARRPALTTEGALKLARMDAARLAVNANIPWSGGKKLLELGQQIEGFAGLEKVLPPASLKAQLRPYQQTGLDWLQFLHRHELGGVLADDMGLGKTVQALAHLTVEKSRRRLRKPALIVCPKSLLPNWRNEAARFAPGLRVLCISGLRRDVLLAKIPEHDLVITTYPLLARDISTMKDHKFSVCICDEAQQLKNHKTKTAIAVRALNAEQRLALTGTPMENHLGELWSLFDWLQPGLLGSEADFRRLYRNPVEKHGDVTMAQRLAKRVKPFLLRRTKQEVATELPPKTEIRQPVEISGAQRDLYETVRVTMDKKVREAIASKGLARSSIEVLEALLKLRQVCCDPRLLNEPADSAKLEMLMDMLPEMIEDGRRILLFSQFTSMLALIEKELEKRGIAYVKLTGQTRDREAPVTRFQRGDVPLFLISLKAGGSGLNLTAADTVIHYDPWWNPAVEAQATDRAYRIGQDKPVFVYKFICEGTVEERMQALQERKAALAAGVYGDGAGLDGTLTADDLQILLRPLGE